MDADQLDRRSKRLQISVEKTRDVRKDFEYDYDENTLRNIVLQYRKVDICAQGSLRAHGAERMIG